MRERWGGWVGGEGATTGASVSAKNSGTSHGDPESAGTSGSTWSFRYVGKLRASRTRGVFKRSMGPRVAPISTFLLDIKN